jgi:signal transduction histidine kinase
MVHEIRNPLGALSNLIYLTIERADEPEVVRSYMHLAREQTATLNEISTNLLGFARFLYVCLSQSANLSRGPCRSPRSRSTGVGFP